MSFLLFQDSFMLTVYNSMVRDAVYAYAYGLKRMRDDLCGAHTTAVCEAMVRAPAGAVLHYLREATFPGIITLFVKRRNI